MVNLKMLPNSWKIHYLTSLFNIDCTNNVKFYNGSAYLINFVKLKSNNRIYNMKFYKSLPLFIVVIFIALSSCNDQATYAEMLADEKSSIQNFIDEKGIIVTSDYPDEIPFPDNVYYLTETGLYIHVIDTGRAVNDSLPKNTVVLVRFVETDMEGDTTYSNMFGTSDPYEILYNNVQTKASYGDCKAWHEPLTYVGDGGHVNLIVPTKLGMSMYLNSSTKLTACFYDLRYTFWK